MDQPERRTLDGSDRSLAEGHTRTGDIDPEEQATITVYVRHRADLAPEGEVLSRADFAARHGAADDDLDAVRRFATEHGLTCGDADTGRRSITVSGRLSDLSEAFGAELAIYADPGGSRYRGRTGPLSVPAELHGVVTSVLGLDQRPQATTQFRLAASPAVQYTPVQIASAYSFPAGSDGSGECVGIVELGGGYRTSDLDTYFSSLGAPVPAVTAVGVDGGTNAPGSSNGPDGEVMLDIEIVGGVAPGARIAVYFAPNTDQGFIDAVTTAIHDSTNRPSVVSISWGGPESTWTAQAMNEMEAAFAAAATLGVTVTVAAGDNGSTDAVSDGAQHVDFPASAPHALACGGTTLRAGSEVVWNSLSSGGGATGGGVSAQFAPPSYQASAHVPVSANPGGGSGRGVPDVAADADPDTGYSVRVDGQDLVIGGTSAVAPLWAGLIARLNQALGRPVGFVHARLYGARGSFRDITSGDNGAYHAGPGWDACTGLGSPDGAAILTALGG